MQWTNTPSSYGAVAKFLHWSIVILIIAQYVLAEAAEELPDGIEKLATISRHKSLGMLVLGLALLRILWKLVSKGQPSPVPMPALQRAAAAAGHGLLYLLVLAQPISGWMMSSAANYPVSWFGLLQLPNLVMPSEALKEVLEEVHEGLFVALLCLAGVHVLAALKHQFVDRDGLITRMLPWGGRG